MPSKQRCCRSGPRCADCPVRLAAAARRAQRRKGVAALVEEILMGAPPRALPEPVVATLAALDASGRR